MKKLICITLLLMLLTYIPVAESASSCDLDNTVSVFFGNGMFTTRLEAAIGLRALQDKLNESLSDNIKVSYFLSYNDNENVFSQLVEVARQENIDNWVNFYNWLSGIGIAPDWFQEAMQEMASDIDEQSYIDDSDLQKHVQKYNTEIIEGKKVIVVSHSQGNFYANRAYGNVASDSLGIVAVATPANFVAGDGQYTTLTNDRVINAVRAVDSGTLPANVTNSSDGEWTGHAFTKSYLDGDISGPRVIGHVIDHIDYLPSPIAAASTGIITVTLEWGEEPDVDLHVFEPNGTHVYYSNLYGISGYLDVDDITSYGPEHYYVECETLEVGTYNIGVNYYSGSSPETARVQVSAGNIVRNYTQSLQVSVGNSGNSSPIPLALINVSKDAEENYVFTVTSQ